MSIIVFGLGGTGIKSLVHLKKMLQDSNSQGEVPNHVRLLGVDTRTTPEQVNNIGAWTSVTSRRKGVNPNQTQLDPYTEYYWIGGDVEAEVCGNGRNNPGWSSDHFTKSWFDLRYFRNHPAHATLKNIRDGAGMYPQIGRLGLYYHLKSGTASPFYQQISRMIRNLPDDTIEIILIGSLAGGTGASLFIDMAHLCRLIAKNEHRNVKVTTMLVLPHAFRWNPPVSVDNGMQVRAMAGLRSLLRFSTIHNTDLGFFFQYTANANDAEINDRTSGALFDMVYLLEERTMGQGQTRNENPLDVPVSDGMAPTMAAWCAALCDGTIIPEANAWIANMRAIESMYDFQGLVPGFCCSFGTYSIILPLSAIIENWTAELSVEVLDQILPPQGEGFDTAKFGGEQSLSGAAQAKRSWDTQLARIVRDAGKVGTTWSKGTEHALASSFQTRTVQEWLQVFVDQRTSAAHQALFEQMREGNTYYVKHAGLFRDPYQGALARPISKKSMGGNVAAAANALHERSETAYQEAAATWSAALKDTAERQIEDYRVAVDKFVFGNLNGDPLDSPVVARSGKLGWVYDHVRQQKEDLNYALKILDIAIQSVEADVNAAEAEWIAGGKGQAGLLQLMRHDESKQKDYLQKRQGWLIGKRWLLSAECYRGVIRQAQAYTAVMETQLKRFIDSVITLKQLLRGLKADIRARRQQAQTDFARVREMVYDPDWEYLWYSKFHNQPNNPPANEAVMGDLSWTVRQITVNRQTVPAISLQIQGFTLVSNSTLESNELSVDLSVPEEQRNKVNQSRIMERCRKQFEGAWNQLTVVDYLAHHYDGVNLTVENLASHLHGKGNALLTAGANNCVPPSWSINLLAPPIRTTMVHPLSEQEVQKKTTLLGSTRDLLRTMTGAQQEFAKILYHNDPTTLTYITIVMGIEIGKLNAFLNPQTNYLKMAVDSIGTEISRKLNFIFPAERNVTLFDRVENGQTRLVSPRITNVFEDETRLAEWLDALALGIIQQTPVPLPNNNLLGDLFRLCLVEKRNLKGAWVEEEIDYWLNDPYNYTDGRADTLVAAEAYCLRTFEYSQARRAMTSAYRRLGETIAEKLKEKLEEFLPWWEQNNGNATAHAVFKLPPSKVRDALLLQETRKELLRRLSPRFQARLGDLSANPPNNVSATTLRTLEDEKEFLSILESRIQQITEHEPILNN